MSITATQRETLAELAGLLAETNRILHGVARQVGFEKSGDIAAMNLTKALDIEHHLRREAGLHEARENNDPFEAA